MKVGHYIRHKEDHNIRGKIVVLKKNGKSGVIRLHDGRDMKFFSRDFVRHYPIRWPRLLRKPRAKFLKAWRGAKDWIKARYYFHARRKTIPEYFSIRNKTFKVHSITWKRVEYSDNPLKPSKRVETFQKFVKQFDFY